MHFNNEIRSNWIKIDIKLIDNYIISNCNTDDYTQNYVFYIIENKGFVNYGM
jgi:hypothetical protein